VPNADETRPVSAAEADALFIPLLDIPALLIAVSGGPDSIALLTLLARWRAALPRGPDLFAATVDHGLRPEAAREARAVKRLAAQLGIPHRTLRWTGDKPGTGLQEAARDARYRLLTAEAKRVGSGHVVTAHTLDDQAETLLIRMARGSGLSGLRAMAAATDLHGIRLLRPLLDVRKSRLLATLADAGIGFADDPSNRDPRFTRVRVRTLLPELAREGLDARRLAQLARRIRRADAALAAAVDQAFVDLSADRDLTTMPVEFDAARFLALPDEIGLRLLGEAIGRAGDEGPVELGKLEILFAALQSAARQGEKLRRTLAGAVVTCAGKSLTIGRAPARRNRPHGPKP